MDQIFPFLLENWPLSGAFLIVLFIYLIFEYSLKFSGAKTLSPALAAVQMNRKNTLVLDIRSEPDFLASHIQGSHHCNFETLRHLTQLKTLAPAQKKNIKSLGLLLIDARGHHAIKAAKLLKKEGYETIMILQGGIEAWRQEKLPLSKIPANDRTDSKDVEEKPVLVKSKTRKKTAKVIPLKPSTTQEDPSHV